ncbi:MAG: hypothetical protein M3507_08230 [Actinomycetota bacterium]|nr:hypothetical protein [Actinomycetota bacterium]
MTAGPAPSTFRSPPRQPLRGQIDLWLSDKKLLQSLAGKRTLAEVTPFEFVLLEGNPVVIFADSEPLRHHLRRARIDEADILEAARTKQGLRASTR